MALAAYFEAIYSPCMAPLSPNIHDKSTTLFAIGLLHLALIPCFALGIWLDPRLLQGVSVWQKPIKFACSITIYLLTMAWIVPIVWPKPNTPKTFVRTMASCMLLEMVLIALQAARGVPSHFNEQDNFGRLVYAAMGIGIGINTLLLVVLLIVLLRTQTPWCSPLRRLGLIYALLLTIAGSLVGAWMSGAMQHSVGGTDGGPGLPLLGWSKLHGDLRVANFFGLHALQILFGLAVGLETFWPRQKKWQHWMMHTVFILYGALFFFTIEQARTHLPFNTSWFD